VIDAKQPRSDPIATIFSQPAADISFTPLGAANHLRDAIWLASILAVRQNSND